MLISKFKSKFNQMVSKQFAILNSNICTTYRMDFCEEAPEYDKKKCEEIEPYKSKYRLDKIFAMYTDFHNKNINLGFTPIYTIQEIRSYNQKQVAEFFDNIGYNLKLFPAYPGVVTENIIIDQNLDQKEKISRKRFSFINGIAIPKLWKTEERQFYLSDTPDTFKEKTEWGKCGSRTVGGVSIKSDDNNILFQIYTTQFGMDVNERLKSARLLTNIFKDSEIPTILTGDFNSFPNQELRGEEQVNILEESFKNATKLAKDQFGDYPGGSFIGMRPVEEEKFCIDLSTGKMLGFLDHIFLRNFRLVKSGVIVPDNSVLSRLYPFSDHCMLWTRVTFE